VPASDLNGGSEGDPMQTNKAKAAKTKGGHASANFFGKCAFGR
jgi:hypothetical protein